MEQFQRLILMNSELEYQNGSNIDAYQQKPAYKVPVARSDQQHLITADKLKMSIDLMYEVGNTASSFRTGSFQDQRKLFSHLRKFGQLGSHLKYA